MPVSDAFHIYDTTLRDGAQQEGLNLSVHDKLTIARHLDDLGVGFIEGGWPGANPKDTEFFALAKKELKLKNATFVAFGATRRPNVKAADDVLLAALRDSHQRNVLHLKRRAGLLGASVKLNRGSSPSSLPTLFLRLDQRGDQMLWQPK